MVLSMSRNTALISVMSVLSLRKPDQPAALGNFLSHQLIKVDLPVVALFLLQFQSKEVLGEPKPVDDLLTAFVDEDPAPEGIFNFLKLYRINVRHLNVAVFDDADAGGRDQADLPLDLHEGDGLLLAQLFGWAGDSLLLGSGFAWFATGIGFFMLGHVCYICLFCRSLKGLSAGKWIVAAVVMAAMLTGVVVAIGIKGVLLAPMALYGGELLVISFCGLCGICRRWGPSRGVWWMVLLGGLLFLFSDSLIAMRTFDEGYFAWRGFVIMLTYLAAQSLLCAAAVKIAITKDPA